MTYGTTEEIQELLTRKEAADMLRVGLRTFDRYVADRKVPKVVLSIRAVRFHLSDIEALLTPTAPPSVGIAGGDTTDDGASFVSTDTQTPR